MTLERSSTVASWIERNSRYIPGGVSSTNRIIDPPLIFSRAEGAYLWDVDGKRYIDYHAAFAPHLLGHNFAPVTEAVIEVLQRHESLYGAGTTVLEGDLAELICRNIPAVDKVCLLNTGSEATALAIRVSRAFTRRQHVIVVQGSYNGNGDELACNVFNTRAEIGPRVSPGEYPLRPLGAGTTLETTRFVHPINFNDLESVRYVCRRHPVAAMITEPVLQNIGVIKPEPGYLEGLRGLADELGFVLIFDEVKTGFRHALGGFSDLCGVRPDLVTYGKAVANGYPLALLGGRRELMDQLYHPDPSQRPLISGTYNGHPVGVAAALRTVQYLVANEATVYGQLESLGRMMEEGLQAVFARHGLTATIARQGSAFSFYFMAHAPVDLHDLMEHHDFELDLALRRALVERGIFVVPIATKQCSISAAHTAEDIRGTLTACDTALAGLRRARA
jgi:glutamate-1-semialdehyde 2,1-aminomutase